MTIYLAGGGNENQSFLVDADFAHVVGTNGHVLYIPIAQAESNYPACEAWFRGCMHPHGIDQITVATTLDQIADLSVFDGIYIGGGNTYRLLKSLHEMQFDQHLINYLADGGVLYGGSAGALILGSDIDVVRCGCGDKNIVDLEDTQGCNLISGFDIQPHYEAAWNERNKAYSHSNGRPILGIPETSALKVKYAHATVIGLEPVTFIQGKKLMSIAPGVMFSLTEYIESSSV